MRKRKSIPYNQALHERLKDQKEAVAYLEAASQDYDPRVFAIALKDVIKAQSQIPELVKVLRNP